MGCSEGLARILVFVANFAFLLVGLALLVVGILYKFSFTKYTDAIPEEYGAIQSVPTLSIIVGAIIFFIAFLGCCGALKNNTCMLSWYGAILIVIFLVQVGLGIFALIKIKDEKHWNQQIQHQMEKLFHKYGTNHEADEAINLIQQNFQCCGTTGPSFWTNTTPVSCYPNNDVNQVKYARGCINPLTDFLRSAVRNIALVAIIVSVTEVAGAVLSLSLSGCIREKRRQGAYY